MNQKEIIVAHSPDPDDAFMFYGLAAEKVPAGPYKFKHQMLDIETLNQAASEGKYPLTAISYHAYPYVADKYYIMRCGSSIGDGYGPIIVGREPLSQESLKGRRVASPGRWTTANLVLQLFQPEVELVYAEFDKIGDLVRDGEVDAGVIIHEGQLTFEQEGLALTQDLGLWWKKETGLPLPLGGNAIRKDLGAEHIRRIADLLKLSIDYALNNRAEALGYAMKYGRNLTDEQADKFVGMYVNDYTLDCGPKVEQALQLLYTRASEKKLIPPVNKIEWI